jgi:DNA replication protein DnaC
MIKRKAEKKVTREYSYWDHYHKMIDLCYDGNPEILNRINNCDDKIQKHYYLANIPEKYFEFEFKEIEKTLIEHAGNELAINNLKKYLDSLPNAAQKGIGLYLHGPHGVAKTTLAIIILKKAISQLFKCYFIKSAEMVDTIKAGWKNESIKDFLDYITNNVDFLIIDDLNRLLKVNDESEKMYIDKIFTKRDDMNLPTIITSNQSIEENKIQLGEALYSNFKERLIEVKIMGSDYRNEIGTKLLKELD